MASYVQSTSVDGSAALAFTSNVTANSTLVAAIRIGGTGLTPTCSDNVNGAWTAGPKQEQTTDGHTLATFYFLNAATGATTVTVANFGAGSTRLAIMEGALGASGGTLDQTNKGQADATTAPSAGNVATSVAVEWIVAAGSAGNTPQWIAGSGYTVRQQTSGGTGKLGLEEKDVASTSTYTGDFTIVGGADNCAAAVMTFYAAGGGDVLMPQILL